jgi:hypothetical protein
VNPNPKTSNKKLWKQKLLLKKWRQRKSIAQAFYEFADKNATINRGEFIHGPEAILDFYKKAGLDSAQLQCAPNSVFVSESGDMAYTYGKYKMSLPDSSGHMITKAGIFHTVWKRQLDGSWKYVWD